MQTNIKYRVLFTFLLVFFFHALHSQSSFEVLFKSPFDDFFGDITEGANNTYYAVGISGYYSEPWNYRGLIFKLRSATDTLSKRIVFSDTVTRFFRIVNSDINEFIILGAISNPPEYKERLLIAGMDTNLTLTWKKEYNLKSYDRLWNINYFFRNDNSMILFGNIVYDSLGGQTDVFFSEITLEGDTIKTGYYLPSNPNVHSGVISSDSSMFWIFGEGFDYNGRGERAEFDTNFNLKRITWIPELVTGYSNSTWYSENKLLFSGKFPIDPFGGGPQDDDFGLSYIDTSLNLTNLHYYGGEDTIDYPAINHAFHFRDTSHIYIAGTYNFIIGFYPQGISWIMTGLLDHNLSSVYFYLYGGDAYYITTSILATSDGGSIICATRYDYHTQLNERDIYFLKLDENGLITSNDLIQSEQSLDPILYPNPGSDIINIYRKWDGTFELYTILGQKLISHNTSFHGYQISITALPSGCYYYVFSNKEGNIFLGKWIKI